MFTQSLDHLFFCGGSSDFLLLAALLRDVLTWFEHSIGDQPTRELERWQDVTTHRGYDRTSCLAVCAARVVLGHSNCDGGCRFTVVLFATWRQSHNMQLHTAPTRNRLTVCPAAAAPLPASRLRTACAVESCRCARACSLFGFQTKSMVFNCSMWSFEILCNVVGFSPRVSRSSLRRAWRWFVTQYGRPATQ